MVAVWAVQGRRNNLLIALQLAPRLDVRIPIADVLLFARLQFEQISRSISGLARVEKDAACGVAVPAAASSFLIVPLERPWDSPVDNESNLLGFLSNCGTRWRSMAYVGLVDSHTEGRRSDDDVVARFVMEPVLRCIGFLVVYEDSSHSTCGEAFLR